jgi:NAD(P)-dependent dehydrogenase (short-subunit alcohol dehydrogenase family)
VTTTRDTGTDYRNPFRRLPVRALNQLSVAGMDARWIRLDEESLLAAARHKTGLTDFGDMWFLEPMRHLIDSIEQEAHLTPMGRVIQRSRLVSALVNRLRAEAMFRRHPSILEQSLGPVIVIAGLQRTGTTLLHRLLASDPRARALLSWEALNPAPFPGDDPSDSRLRKREARRAQRALRYLAPEFFAIHPVEHDAPEEDVLLLDLAFMSQAPEATMHVPSYARWLESQDHRPAYRDLRGLLQLLHWQRAGEHWILKTPHHMEHLDALLEVFPEAKVVQTHRDPHKTMASFCSMVAHGRGVFSDHVDPDEVGRHWLRKVGRMLERSMAVRDASEGDRFLDVAYADLVANPTSEVARIREFAGLDFRPETRDALASALSRNVRNRYGKHIYGLADFGLSSEAIARTFADYRARFEISAEEPTAERARGHAKSDSEPTHLGHDNPVTATLTGILDRFGQKDRIAGLEDSDRIDGKVCLVTGSSRGLGLAVAKQLAERGGHVIMACRSRIPEAGDEVKAASGSGEVEMLQVDLSDLDSVARLCDRLRDDGVRIDIAVLNAGLMPRRARRTPQGLEEMFAVHFLANRLLIARWLEDGVIAREGVGRSMPRIILVSSESHRSAEAIDFDRFGEFVEYGLSGGMAQYGGTKLHMSTFACELSRQLNPGGQVRVSVCALCPGPIDSSITREAPALVKPLLGAVTRVFFRSPEDAAEPVVYLACAPSIEGTSGRYMHMMADKAPSPLAADPEHGRRLWRESARLLEHLGHPIDGESPAGD